MKRSTIIVALSTISSLMAALVGSVRAQTGLGTVAAISGKLSGVFENGVVTPAASPRDSYPVMVWFHGGASMHGYSWEPEFEPSNLVKKGVVVVSVGYRLGVFGFLATQALPTPAFVSKDTARSEVYCRGFGPCTDGHALSRTPVEYFSKPNSLDGIQLMFGSNSGDANDSFRVLTKEDILKDARRVYGDLVDKYDFSRLYPGVDDVGASWEYWRLKNLQLATTSCASMRLSSMVSRSTSTRSRQEARRQGHNARIN